VLSIGPRSSSGSPVSVSADGIGSRAMVRGHLPIIWGMGVLGLVIATAAAFWRPARPASELGDDPAAVTRGEAIYAAHCASCHGKKLEGQADWQSPRADEKMPALPHNSDGHTWHHNSATLFGITKHGLVPPWAPANYRSDMPAFAGVLSDEEIRAVHNIQEWQLARRRHLGRRIPPAAEPWAVPRQPCGQLPRGCPYRRGSQPTRRPCVRSGDRSQVSPSISSTMDAS
jgi:mono/diheme cytochrome c family protein